MFLLYNPALDLDGPPEREVVPGRGCPGPWQNFFPSVAFRHFAVNIYQKSFVTQSSDTLTVFAMGKLGGHFPLGHPVPIGKITLQI